ncbi:protein of unknown function [Methylorubrum extorquens]|uniref:Uncharacterized protein n=1 Tax=Methylorubrum extorquens TaxID=408 RepID=A0A2N9AVW6_METEX|nr:protein of unknown function [Methylorubrum extorquens]
MSQPRWRCWPGSSQCRVSWCACPAPARTRHIWRRSAPPRGCSPPFPEALDGGDVPAWVREKTVYGGFLGGAPAGAVSEEDGRIVMVFGRGGEGGRLERLVQAADAVPDRAWHVLGPVTGAGAAPKKPASPRLGHGCAPASRSGLPRDWGRRRRARHRRGGSRQALPVPTGAACL